MSHLWNFMTASCTISMFKVCPLTKYSYSRCHDDTQTHQPALSRLVIIHYYLCVRHPHILLNLQCVYKWYQRLLLIRCTKDRCIFYREICIIKWKAIYCLVLLALGGTATCCITLILKIISDQIQEMSGKTIQGNVLIFIWFWCLFFPYFDQTLWKDQNQ